MQKPLPETPKAKPGRGLRFWLVIVTLCTANFIGALDIAIVPTLLPTLAARLHSDQYEWVGAACV